ncbi:MAG: efflux RND transporter periplasmic adaptor subunit [Terriglobia bacterium]|jgi:HlyD family secretion protein
MSARTLEEKDETAVAQVTGLELGRTTSPEGANETSGAPSRPRNGKGKKSRKKMILVIVGALALVGLVAGGIIWSKGGVVTVQTLKVTRADLLSAIVTASGEIKPPTASLANVNANSYGKITDIFVKEGDTVKKGQLLLKTEAVQANATVDAQKATVSSAKADVEQFAATVQAQQAALNTALANVQTAQANLVRNQQEFKRGEDLLRDKLIAQNEFDTRLDNVKVAQATLDGDQAAVVQQRALLQQARFNLDSARAKVAMQEAQLVSTEDVRDKTIYNSPLDGIVTSLPVHVGENVVPGIQNAVGSLLYQVSDLAVITAEVKVDETDIVNVKLGQTAEVTIDAIPNKTFKGKVTEIGQSAVGRTSGVTTGTSTSTTEEAKDFKVVVTLDDPPPGLRPGLSTTAKITTATRQNAVTIPIQALTVRTRRQLEEEESSKGAKGKVQAATSQPTTAAKDKGKEEVQGAFQLKDGRAVFVPVESGIMGQSDVEVLKGVQPNEEIVSGPFSVLRTLKNHTKVKVDNSALKPAGSTS